jgi:hypothetical protein
LVHVGGTIERVSRSGWSRRTELRILPRSLLAKLLRGRGANLPARCAWRPNALSCGCCTRSGAERPCLGLLNRAGVLLHALLLLHIRTHSALLISLGLSHLRHSLRSRLSLQHLARLLLCQLVTVRILRHGTSVSHRGLAGLLHGLGTQLRLLPIRLLLRLLHLVPAAGGCPGRALLLLLLGLHHILLPVRTRGSALVRARLVLLSELLVRLGLLHPGHRGLLRPKRLHIESVHQAAFFPSLR